MTVGYVIQETILPTRTERAPLNFVSDSQPYITGGGVIFNYPVGWFTQAPIVTVTLQQDVSHPNNIAYVTEVSNNTPTSTTVMVYQVSTGVINEAPTGVMTVCLFALDKPL